MAIYHMAMNQVCQNTTLLWLFDWHVLQDVQKKAREEALRVLGDKPEDVMPDSEQVKSLPYIDMVIKEVKKNLGWKKTWRAYTYIQ